MAVAVAALGGPARGVVVRGGVAPPRGTRAAGSARTHTAWGVAACQATRLRCFDPLAQRRVALIDKIGVPGWGETEAEAEAERRSAGRSATRAKLLQAVADAKRASAQDAGLTPRSPLGRILGGNRLKGLLSRSRRDSTRERDSRESDPNAVAPRDSTAGPPPPRGSFRLAGTEKQGSFRSNTRELALGIRADAERQTVVIEAQAYRQAEQIRGDGDAQSAAIYADAFNKDPDFYQFYRSINAYTNVFKDKSDFLVLDPNSEFFKYLERDPS